MTSDPQEHDLQAQGRDVAIRAADGYPLGARLWAASGATSPATVALVNAGAGISLRYYERFAAYLAAHGVPTVVYDYRGIGASRPASLRGFAATVEDWGKLDCCGVLEWIAAQFPGVPRTVIGHSVGGFVTGFTTNGHLVDRMLLVSAHTGYWRDYAARARPWMYVLWHALMPAVTRAVGYFPGRRLHLLEDLPRGAALQWAARRRADFWWNLRTPDGEMDTARIDEVRSRFRALHAATLALQFTDDPFATDAATDRMLGLYENCRSARLRLGPADAAGQPIGHFGFFRARFRETLWPRALAWLAAPGVAAEAAPAGVPA